MAAPGLRLSICQFFPLKFLNFVVFFNLIGFCAAEDHRYRNCAHNFSCGGSIRDIGYPFWGGDRPQDCGVTGLELQCSPDNFTTINIARESYRVLSIHVGDSLMRIVRTDLLDGVCEARSPNSSSSIDINSGRDEVKFEYSNDVGTVYLLYSCPATPPANISERFQFNCSSNGTRESLNYAVLEALVDYRFPNGMSCEHNLTVPVIESTMKKFTANGTISITASNLMELVGGGFDMEYKLNAAACTSCGYSGGLCWSGTNSHDSPTCLCRSGLPRSNCDKGRKFSLLIVGTIIGLTLMIALLLIISCITKWRKVREQHQESNKNVENLLNIESLAPKRYSYTEIKKITKSFTDKVGEGGYGIVYKGWLPDGQAVAVKLLNETNGSGEEFINEVASMSRTAHVNIVNLLGFCYNGKRRALVYEFMPNHSLDKFINRSDQSNLDWETLYNIAVGAARGLEYLHRGCNTRIVHFDIKPHNILLDEDFSPKISDFGLAKLFKKNQSNISGLGTWGTIGYIAPEIFSRNFGAVSNKSDVYSYGMVLLEMSGARKIDAMEGARRTSSEVYFLDKIYEHVVVNNNKLDELLNKENEERAMKILLVGIWCIQTAPADRPSMSNVLEMLEGTLESIQIPPKPVLSVPTLPVPPFSSTLSTNADTEN